MKDKIVAEYIVNIIWILLIIILIFKRDSKKIKSIIDIKKMNLKLIVHNYLLLSGTYIGYALLVIPDDNNELPTKSILFIVYGIILAPLIEEIFFRGFLFYRIKSKIGLKSGIIISSLIFALLHFDLNIIGRVIFAMLAAILCLETNNLINSIVLHIINNLTVFIIYFLSSQSLFTSVTQNEITILVIIAFVSILISIIVSVIYIKNKFIKLKNKEITI